MHQPRGVPFTPVLHDLSIGMRNICISVIVARVPVGGIPKEIVEKVRVPRERRVVLRRGAALLELSGGVFRCAICGRALVAADAMTLES